MLKAVLFVLAFPLVEVAIFTAYYAVGYARFKDVVEQLPRYNILMYAILLLMPIAVALNYAHVSGSLAAVGLQLPRFAGLRAPWAAIVCTSLAVATGYILFVNEATLLRLTDCAINGARVRVGWRNEKLASAGFAAPLALYFACAEELVWRGYLIGAFHQAFPVTWVVSIVISGFAFGSAHAHVGIRNVLLKWIMGTVLGIYYSATHSLLGPVIAHMTFNYAIVNSENRRSGS